MTTENNAALAMNAILSKQKAAHVRDGIPTAQKRIEWIDKSIDLLLTHSDELCEAMRQDFGHRPVDQTQLTDIAASVMTLKNSKKNLTKWMRPEKRKVQFPLGLLGAKAQLQYQPKGVVGAISPWNFPVLLTFSPLANIFAAGNRAMLKPSEFTENTSALMKSLFAKYYTEEEVAVITGGPDVGAAFSKLPFDHLVFTGATSIARHVMRSAADNLVPLTLELGGKSPVIIGKNADIDKAAKRIMMGKTLNAGQICLAPDYVFVDENNKDEFVAAAQEAVKTMFPSGLVNNDDYCSMINQPHFDRINSYVEEARNSNAEVLEINPADENFSDQAHRKIAPTLIVGVQDDLKVSHDEIFGPILPIKTYQNVQEVIDYVNARPRPLALYYFGQDKVEQKLVLNNTTSGGVTLNDVIYHAGQEDLPFGGVGDSGMGAYHGIEGFKEFSHKKAIYSQLNSELLAMLRPPYGDNYRKQISRLLKK